MLSISNFGSSTNCQSSQMHAYANSCQTNTQCHVAVWYVVNTLLYGEIKCLSDLKTSIN